MLINGGGAAELHGVAPAGGVALIAPPQGAAVSEHSEGA
jgi:hypothetical protein